MKKFVVIGGMYRSGTTLTETIIGSHPEISIPPRDFTFFDYYKNGDDLKSVYDKLDRRGIWKRWNKEIINKQNIQQDELPNYETFFNDTPKHAYIASLTTYAEMINKTIAGVKCPRNEFYYDTIRTWLSDFDVRFIHLVRNPFDMVASFQNSSYYGDAVKNNPANIAVHSKNWCRSTSLALARVHCDPRHYFLVKYEDLALEPKQTAQRLCEFLEIDMYEERMLQADDFAYYGSNTSFENQERSSSSDFVKAPKSRKKYLNEMQIKTIGSICGELAHAMGYRDEDFGPAEPDKFIASIPPWRSKLKRIADSIVSKL